MVKGIAKLILYWLLFFLFQRFIFLTINYESLNFGWFQILTACQKAFAMDLATAIYLSALPLLLYIMQGYTDAFKSAIRITNTYHYIMIGFCSIVAIGDAGIYQVWFQPSCRFIGSMVYQCGESLFTNQLSGKY